jgi:NADP-dependent 3-hydroxy acid dehydrogenase YdfG
VVITGAGSGMGKELAMRYAKRNCKVVIGDIQLNKLKEV